MTEALLVLLVAAAIAGWGGMVVTDLVEAFTVPLPPAPEQRQRRWLADRTASVRVVDTRRIWPARFWTTVEVAR